MTYQIAMLVGSTRNGSLNQRLAKAIEKEAGNALKFSHVSMVEMPFYDADKEPDRPSSVNAFTAAISSADAVFIVTPEYNRSIPGVLKNAIDWGSKPPKDNIWRDKVVAMTGTSPGAIGTAVAQQHLRQILAILGAHVLPGEAYISFKTPEMIDEVGNVTDESVRQFVADFTARFAKFVERVHG